MQLLRSFLTNHVFANLTFAVVMIMGIGGYIQMPREQDPEINFNWISITTPLRGASAEDVEKLVTQPLEDAIRKVSDIRFVSSSSREGISTILVRFEDISTAVFDKRINDLRREIQNKANQELPPEVDDPTVLEITTSNGFPTVMVLVLGQSDDEILRATARQIRDDVERISGVDDVLAAGLHDPELVVDFDPASLEAHNLTATQLSDAVASWFRDVFGGRIRIGEKEWLVRMVGKEANPDILAAIPVTAGTERGPIPLSSLAKVSRLREKPSMLAAKDGRAGVLLSVTKKGYTNTLELVDRINQYVDRRNEVLAARGIQLVLVDDQTVPTREAISIMQTNAALGLLLVLLTTWVFLGSRIAVLLSLGIPFSLAGTFAVIYAIGWTINVSILLGVVIVLGMLVDDAVVVVEGIYYRITRGMDAVTASLEALREVFAPVTASVMTTMAAFLPLMLLPGIVGKFMMVVPAVVTLALAFSLIEAYWMLPAHVMGLKLSFDKPSRAHQYRVRFTHLVRVKYSRALLYVMRRPKRFLLLAFGAFMLALSAVATGLVRIQFFAFDPIRLFYVNVDMPAGTALEESLARVMKVEDKVRKYIAPEEQRAITSLAGVKYTDTEPLYANRYAQVVVSLNPREGELRGVDEVIAAMRDDVASNNGDAVVTFTRISGGPPLTKPVSVKVRGDEFGELRKATDYLAGYLSTIEGVSDITDDDSPGRDQLTLRLNLEALQQSGLNAATVARTIRLYVDGEVVTFMQDQGEKVEVRVRAEPQAMTGLDQLLDQPVPLPDGGQVAMRELVRIQTGPSKESIRHYNFRRTITLEADIDRELLNEVQVNDMIKDEWEKVRLEFPNVTLDFSGALDDIQESLDAMLLLFIFGIGLIYLIIGTQFRSYLQPLMILVTVPLAFTGVVVGLLITGNPMSLYTMYGVVALTGIAVNSAIVLIDAANRRLRAGMSVLHAIVYAARRRVVPILITSFTTVAGLFSLATGLGGESLLWGPVASSIMWGLAVGTVMTLFVIPLIYRAAMSRGERRRRVAAA
ncbi:MAG: efflux RND transporter permease subunit [Betaproteobacteria bacterium]|nr:MAG: efflux RND transporter permease subunit [Betaproteobacteria bacterium]